MANSIDFKGKTLTVGDRIIVNQIIKEDEKSRIQVFEGLLMSIKGRDINKTILVRKIASGSIGVERIIPLESPNISSIEVKSHGNVRRSKLTYLRKRVGRSALRVKESKDSKQSPKKAV